MKLTVLTENNARIDNYLLAEPGLSLLLEYGEHKILFDTGYSDVFIKNAVKLGIDLSKITEIVISHGHNDHTRGLTFFDLRNVPLIAHPKIFDDKICKDRIHKGCALPIEDLKARYDLVLSRKPYWISEELVFLGEISDNKTPDIDDTALVYRKENGIFIITGCSHSGIVNIVRYAKKICNENRILGVFGGFHMVHKTTDEMKVLSEQLIKEGVSTSLPIYPCHCCDLFSKIEFAKYFNVKEVCVGDILYL